MASLDVNPGDAVPLSVQLWDRDTGKFVRARLYDTTNTEIVGSPVTLTHVVDGLYTAAGPTMPNGNVSVVYNVYDDALFATLSVCHLPGAMCARPTKECETLEAVLAIDPVKPVQPVFVTVEQDEVSVSVLDDEPTISISDDDINISVTDHDASVLVTDDESEVKVEKCE